VPADDRGPLVAVDVDYRDACTVAAAVGFAAWTDAVPIHEVVVRTDPAAPYVPGELWRRELPPILAVLAALAETPRCVIVDAYVWLPPDARAGLGMHLHRTLGVAVVGVAKNPLHADTASRAIVRGTSRTPLYVTAVGLDGEQAAQAIASMHGPFRVPTLLRRVDRLCREG
jgi:deoxyribonuclease V